jgi:Na+-driven multidrug efflux pump
MVVTFSIVIMIVFVPLSFGFATSALIGAALGKGDARRAKTIACHSVILSLICSVVIILFLRHNALLVISIYTDSVFLKQLTVSSLNAYCFVFILDSI